MNRAREFARMLFWRSLFSPKALVYAMEFARRG